MIKEKTYNFTVVSEDSTSQTYTVIVNPFPKKPVSIIDIFIITLFAVTSFLYAAPGLIGAVNAIFHFDISNLSTLCASVQEYGNVLSVGALIIYVVLLLKSKKKWKWVLFSILIVYCILSIIPAFFINDQNWLDMLGGCCSILGFCAALFDLVFDL